MPDAHLSCVLLADSHHRLTEGVRGLLETAFGTVVLDDVFFIIFTLIVVFVLPTWRTA
jgi:hypothetical protein